MDITEQLSAIAASQSWQYVVKGEPIAYEKVFSPAGLLPAIMRRADQLCSFCLGYGLGLTFERSDSATLGVVVQMDTTTPSVLRLLCILDVLYEFMNQSHSPQSISLDELMLD